MKKRIFIGSSIEARELAQRLSDALSDRFECVLWYEGFFSIGSHFYTDLVQKIITFDYAVMIGNTDDRVTRISTSAEKTAPRDNVYLEYGLFSGILSPKRVLLLLHWDCKEASDLSGMSLAQYRSNEEAVALTENWLRWHEEESKTVNRSDVGLLPTVGVAVGYYYNFLQPFLQKLRTSGLSNGKKLRMKVCVPDFVCDNIKAYKEDLINGWHLREDQLCNYRILVGDGEEGELCLYDVPTTFLAIFKTVNYVLGVNEGNTEDATLAKLRAMNNFCEILTVLIGEDLYARRTVEIIRYGESDVYGG